MRVVIIVAAALLAACIPCNDATILSNADFARLNSCAEIPDTIVVESVEEITEAELTATELHILTLERNPNLLRVSLPNLERIDILTISRNTQLTSLDLPALTDVDLLTISGTDSNDNPAPAPLAFSLGAVNIGEGAQLFGTLDGAFTAAGYTEGAFDGGSTGVTAQDTTGLSSIDVSALEGDEFHELFLLANDNADLTRIDASAHLVWRELNVTNNAVLEEIVVHPEATFGRVEIRDNPALCQADAEAIGAQSEFDVDVVNNGACD
jgi:hypothetical protein